MTVFEPRGDKACIDGFVLETDVVNANALEVAYELPADHQRTRPMELVWKPEVVSHRW